ncbi:hypothetical protein [Actinomyces succiniciruminis]|uniref:Uncharacterized protein n=1 Tax=Actinomyces succiniciruminis TaxID=1522002 RepID=A0A1L7RMC9_9ACTO|nr:hypothetical protein [Actinomyces succiniciruminis]CED90628.1 Hypothetical protein AAM4_0796 [Actinomyces succiniciruminis]
MVQLLDVLDAAPIDQAPRSGADRSQVMVATVLDVAEDGRTVTVSLLGSDAIPLPATASVWTDVTTAHVLMDTETGRPVHVLGPATAPSTEVTVPSSESLEEASQPATVTRTATVTPDWSGTYRAGQGWDRWNTNRYGGRTDIYQGAIGSSGALRGMATYGTAITSLHADRIASAILTMTGTGSWQGTWAAVVQAADRTSAGPSPSGATATANITGTGTTRVDITALAAGLLAGKGLALVGSAYGAVGGRGQSMSITITYQTTQ